MRDTTPNRHKRRRRSRRGPNGNSVYSLRRAINSGWKAPQPTREAKLRHAWFRRKVSAAKLRIALHQELSGDAELAYGRR